MDTKGEGPRTRSGSNVLQAIQETACPLDGPIRFGKTTQRNGKVVQKKYVSTGDMVMYDKRGNPVVTGNSKLVRWEGKYNKICKSIANDLPEVSPETSIDDDYEYDDSFTLTQG